MGQNQSTTFGDGTLRRDSPDPLPPWPRSPQAQVDQEPLSSSASPTIKIKEGHARPIPPPLNPSDVRRQAQELDEWVAVDDEDDVFISTGTKKRKIGDLNAENDFTSFEPGENPIPGGEIGLTSPVEATPTTDSPSPKKRRLLATDRAKELTDQELLDRFNAKRAIWSARRPAHVFDESSVTSSDDQGNDNEIFDTGEKDASSFSSISDEEGLVENLAKLHQESMSKPQICSNDRKITPEGERRSSIVGENDYATVKQKKKKEHESAELSRKLREERLGTTSDDLFDDSDIQAVESGQGSESLVPDIERQDDAAVHDERLLSGSESSTGASPAQTQHDNDHRPISYSSNTFEHQTDIFPNDNTSEESFVSDENIDVAPASQYISITQPFEVRAAGRTTESSP